MKISIVIMMLGWLIQNDIDYSHKIFVREVQTVFNTDATKLQKVDMKSINGDYDGMGQFFRVADQGISGFAYVGRVNSCRSGGCSLGGTTPDFMAEYFDYFILFDEKAAVRLVRVFNYQATHGHGITSKGWLRQFVGYNGSQQLEPGKNVDAISGATISVKAITSDVAEKTKILRDQLIML
jgi:hypothetical protein